MMSFSIAMIAGAVLSISLLGLSLTPPSLTSSLPTTTIASHPLSPLHLAYLSLLVSYLLFVLHSTNATSNRISQVSTFFCLFSFLVPSLFLNIIFDSFVTQVTLTCLITSVMVWGGWVVGDWLKERGYAVESYPLIGSLPQYTASFPRRHLFELDVIKEHGPSVPMRIGDQKGVWVADPKDVEYMLKTNQQNFEQGEGRKQVFKDLLGDGIFNVDGHMWETQRKAASKEFSVSRFRDYMLEIFSEFALEVMGRLEEAAINQKPVDVQDLFFRYTFDSFGKLAFGLDVGCLSGEESPPFAYAFDQANVLTSQRFFDVLWPLKRMFGIGSEGELAQHIKTINDYVFKIVEDRKKLSKEELSSNRDLLSRFMALKMADGGEPDAQFLRDLVTNFMLAGRDTTASGLSWTIFHIFQNPEAMEKARQEIADFIPKDPIDLPLPSSLANPPSQPPTINRPTYDQLKKMHYLHSIFSEALRLNPPVPTDGKTLREDDVLPSSGIKIKGGQMAAFMPFAMGRLPELWGTNAADFVPERWLDKEGKFKRESPFKYTVFQAGPRQCLGIDFAYLEAKLILAMILQRYNLKMVKKPEEVAEGEGLTMAVRGGLEVIVERI